MPPRLRVHPSGGTALQGQPLAPRVYVINMHERLRAGRKVGNVEQISPGP